jgi:hypothetical protein
MTIITAQTTFNILDVETYEESVELIILPENDGLDALRELHYPAGNSVYLPPLIYTDNPDKYENFDSGPLTARPIMQSDQTLRGNTISRWLGYVGDAPIVERWQGSDSRSRMYLYFLRRLWEYFANPPMVGYISWWPKDRTATGYSIEIESLTAGGSQITMDYLGVRGGMVTGEIALTFRIIGEATE